MTMTQTASGQPAAGAYISGVIKKRLCLVGMGVPT
jgi:hypothetical protein